MSENPDMGHPIILGQSDLGHPPTVTVIFQFLLPDIALYASDISTYASSYTIIVSKDEIGIVNKKWVLFGKNRTLPDGAIIALNGEAGIQADTLAPGIHFGLWIWQYTIYKAPFTTIDRGHIGIVEARDGHARHRTQARGRQRSQIRHRSQPAELGLRNHGRRQCYGQRRRHNAG